MASRIAHRIGLAAICAAVLAPAATIVHYPYLQNLRSDRVTIRWTTRESGVGAVEYSTDRSFSRSAPARMQEFPPSVTGMSYTYYRYQAILTGLAAGAEYFYRILVDGEEVTADDELRFRTRASSPFQFLAFGDSGAGTPEQSRMAQLMLQERPALLLHTGDIAYPSGSFERYQSRYFDYYRHLMKRSPFFPSPGNHDYQSDNAESYMTVHAVPTEEVPAGDQGRYYSFDWGNAHFIALDSNASLTRAANGTGGMLQWLENDLRTTRQFWRIAYFHHPPYAAGPNENDPLSALARSQIVPILEKYGVPLVLNGHEHSYQRSWPIRQGEVVADAGTVYITTGGGGVSLYPVFPRPFLAYAEPAHHYVRGEVDGFRMTLRAIRIDELEIDSVTLAPPPILSGNAVVNAASFTTSVAPGGLVSIFGTQLAAGESPAPRLPLPTTLSGVTVTLNGQRLPLVFISPAQINAQLPFDVQGRATLRVATPNGSSETPVTISETAPALFPSAVLHQDGTAVTDASPAQIGETISVFLTGLGRVNGEIAAGQPAPASPPLAARASVLAEIGGVTVTPFFAGLAPGFAGLYQVNLRIPQLASGIHALRVVAPGAASNAVGVPVGPPAGGAETQ